MGGSKDPQSPRRSSMKKELTSKKKRLMANRAQVGEPENIFNEEVVEAQPEEQAEQAQVEETTEEKVSVKRRRKATGKKLNSARQLVDSTKSYPIEKALDLIRKASYTTFVGTVELHLIMKDKGAQGNLTLPHGTGKEVKVAVFAHDEATSKAATEAGADVVGGKDLTDDIQNNRRRPGKDFDLVVAHPQAMVFVTPLARILGPKKMMPNPKNNTVGTNVAEIVKELKKGRLNFKAETVNPYVVHTVVGKLNFKNEQLKENLDAILAAVGIQKVRKAYLSATMSPSVTLNLA